MKKGFLVFLWVGAISMIAMAAHYLQADDTGILRRKEIASSTAYFWLFRTHVLSGLIAISIGPLQFIERIRRDHVKLHRTAGFVYFVNVLLSSLSALAVAPFAMGGVVSAVGFSLLGLVWFSITVKAWLSIFRRQIDQHMQLSLLSYSLTFAAITQRTLLLVPLLTGVPFLPIYQLSAWLPWMLNLVIGGWVWRRYYQDVPQGRLVVAR